MPSFFGNLGRSLQEKGVYNTWMFQEQDLIQSFAHTYADRIIAEAFVDVVPMLGNGAKICGLASMKDSSCYMGMQK